MTTDKTYSRQELLAGMLLLEWAWVQMYVFGTGEKARLKALIQNDPEAIRALKLTELMTSVGHHRFRDMIADLASAHAEGQRLGIENAGIKDNERSHDVIWTQLFMTDCVDVSPDGFALRPNWRLQATAFWQVFADDLTKGVRPDFDVPGGRAQSKPDH